MNYLQLAPENTVLDTSDELYPAAKLDRFSYEQLLEYKDSLSELQTGSDILRAMIDAKLAIVKKVIEYHNQILVMTGFGDVKGPERARLYKALVQVNGLDTEPVPQI